MYAQNEFDSEYGSLSTESQVNQIYKNLFDRSADTAGLTYWTKEINLGNLKLAEIANHLIWAAQNNSGSEDDKTALTNRTNAAVASTTEVESTAAGILAYQAQSTDPWVAGDNITEAKSYMSGIDKDTAHTAAGVTTSVGVITTNGVPAEKKTFTLTTSVDTFTGGDGADTFTADNTGTTATSSTADTVKGGDGTDTIEIFTSGTAATAAIPKLTSVEKLNIYDMDVAFDAS
jgi:Ca2+-binding RTX toxin-like protein